MPHRKIVKEGDIIKYLLLISAVLSLVFAVFKGEGEELTAAILSASENAVTLTFTLLGAMAFWGGVMRVAEKSGLIKKIGKLFRPLLKKLFKGIDENGEAFSAIVMNISANLMGLGNAATPLGIKAMKALSAEENARGTATGNMIMLVVLNTASLQLLPTTVATLRLSYGSKAPLDVLPSILFSAACALAAGVTLTLILNSLRGRKGEKK